MKKALLTYKTILLCALLLFTIRAGMGSIFSSASDITPANILYEVNHERTIRNLNALTPNLALSAAAQYKANDMIQRRYFSHVDPDGNYIWNKIVQYGYNPYTTLGENLAVDFSDTESLMAAWMNSPSHRENILNPAFQDQGAGVTFGDPNSGQFIVAIANTFGAQPAKAATKPAQTKPLPKAPKIAKKPKKPVPKIAQKPNKLSAQTPTVTINNSDTISHVNAVVIVGSATPNSAVQITDKSQSNENTSTTADAQGNFSAEFDGLANGEHDFVATATNDGGTASDIYSININYQPPVITNLQVSASAGNDLVLHVEANITKAGLVNATVLDKTVKLQANADSYSGDITFDKYFDYQSQNLTVSAEDVYGNVTNKTIPLQNVNLPGNQNPKSFKQAPELVKQPDLYNVFKYMVIIFGGLFIVFFIIDIFVMHKNKKTALPNMTSGSNIILLLLLVSTLLLVSWWH